MNKLLLLRPISRALCVQKPIICYRHFNNKSFSTTTCRKFGSTLINKTEEKDNTPHPAAKTVEPLTLPPLLEVEAVETETNSETTDLTRNEKNDNLSTIFFFYWQEQETHIYIYIYLRFFLKAVTFPDLRIPSPLLDPRDVYELPPTKDNPYHNRVIIRNHRSVFHEYPPDWETSLISEEGSESQDQGQQDEFLKSLPVPSKYYSKLHQAILMRRPVVQQTGKGKIRRISYMVLVGDGNGMVGYGLGKHSNARIALRAAQLSALKNMDWVERFEKRTIWTEMETKYGATHLILRPRPVGFGLRCNPYLHQILRAAGLKDISAKVWGSRNKLNVIKAAFRIIHAGHAPTSMGDGIGGKGMKQSKGVGIRSMSDVERARGRKLISLRR